MMTGVGIAVRGDGSGVKWGWNGVGQIIASWFIAPAIAGGFAAIVFLFTKFVVLRAKQPVKVGLMVSPLYFFIVSGVLTVSIIVKGSPSLKLTALSPGTTAGAVIGTAAVVALLSVLFWLPWVYCQVIRRDYTVRWYHFFLGPLLWRRQAPADALTSDKMVIQDYYEGHHGDTAPTTHEADANDTEAQHTGSSTDGVSEKDQIAVDSPDAPVAAPLANVEKSMEKKTFYEKIATALSQPSEKTLPDGRPIPPVYRTFDGCWLEPWNLYTIFRHNAFPWLWYTVTGGFRVDIHKMQMHASAKEQARLRGVHARAEHFDNEAEHLFSFLQVMTACTASFAHGANDVSNAVGPLAVVYEIWSTTGMFPGRNTPTPVWILAYGGAAIVIGLATYGWRLMSVLGNRLTLHSPSRGVSRSCLILLQGDTHHSSLSLPFFFSKFALVRDGIRSFNHSRACLLPRAARLYNTINYGRDCCCRSVQW